MSQAFLETYPVIMGEGSMYERLRRGGGHSFDPDIAYAGMLYEETGRKVLAETHREYLDIGQRYGLPMVAGTPTWRAGGARVARSAHADKAVNADACNFMKELRNSYGPNATPILVAGVTGPFGDGYLPDQAPDTGNAIDIHKPQIEEIALTGIDFFKVQTLPSFAEARGIAKVLETTGLPYVLSFVIRRDGCILDGTPLEIAIETIDEESRHPPENYSVNCVHASVFSAAYKAVRDRNPNAAERILGIDANTSAKTPEELEGLVEIDTEAPSEFGTNLASLHKQFGTNYLGGCCGSSTEHIASLAEKLISLTLGRA